MRKELERCCRFIRENLYSQQLRIRVLIERTKCELLEDNVIVQYSWLKDNTRFSESLEVTEDRQFREHGLLHISDQTFCCFKRIEEIRVVEMNRDRLVPGNRSDFLDVVIEKIQCYEILRDAWRGAFEDLGADKEVWLSKKSYFPSANIICHFVTYLEIFFQMVVRIISSCSLINRLDTHRSSGMHKKN